MLWEGKYVNCIPVNIDFDPESLQHDFGVLFIFAVMSTSTAVHVDLTQVHRKLTMISLTP